jgi:DNA (cytosine-5)-methyltransferase 1
VTGELIVDSFAGGGGASTGIELALGRSPDIAINHDPEAVALHVANHPASRHFCESVWKVDPVEACGGRPVGLAWFSPDCKHFSKAKGGKPVSKKIRGLAWVVTRWAKAVRPRVICLENVEEFQTWGPLLEDGTPCPARRGLTFRRFVAKLRSYGYAVEWRELRACDYGAPTSRKRLFLVARCDGQPIAWPDPTHGPGRLPYLTAADCIDWSAPCPSIFDRAKPLAENTLRRIARGIRKYVIESARPFIVEYHSARRPGDDRAKPTEEPLPTQTTANRFGLVAPTLIQTGYGERPGQAPRSLDLHEPLGTVVAGGAKHALVSAFLAKHYGGHEGPGTSLRLPLDTITTQDHHALVTAQLGGEPDRREQVRAFLLAYYGTEQAPQLGLPMPTVTTHDRFGLVTVAGQDYVIADIGMRMLTPRELYRAQGFPSGYQIDIEHQGRPLTKTAQVRMAGNAVCPPIAAAIVRANCGELERVAVAA